MKHLDLFAGIGGFSLAAQLAGWETIAHCEINPFCQKVLHKHFPASKLHADIKELDGKQYRGAVDIITGGFPCQPCSSAGKRLGKEDERHLWPEMLRVIREVSPRWVVGENVRGLVNWNDGVVFEEVQTDLESAGYEVQAFLLPAAGVGAPHQRQRIWFVAYTNSKRMWDAMGSDSGQRRSDANSLESKVVQQENGPPFQQNIESYNTFTADANANISRSQGSKNKEEWQQSTNRNAWDFFPTQSGVCRGNDGVPNRVDRIKALGNAIVPQVALQIFKAINQYETLNPAQGGTLD